MLSAQQKADAWKRGILSWKLDSNQLKHYRLIRKKMASPFARYVLNWARRTGKTYLLLLIGVEESIRKKRARIVVASTTKESLQELSWPILESIFEDCPTNLMPILNEGRKRVIFKQTSKSMIVMGSCDTKRTVERMRGPKADLVIIEEGGTIPDRPGLKYVMSSVLKPQLYTTGGPMLFAMTPPESPGHYSVTYLHNARAVGNYSHCTLFDNPRISPDQRSVYLETDAEDVGMTVEEYQKSTHYRREWMAEILVDPETAVLPGFTEAAASSIVVDKFGTEPMVRQFADQYDSMDVGWSPDFTGVLFAYWDFARKVLCIERELLIRRMNTEMLAEAIREKESKWTRQPFLRASDISPILIHDLASLHGLTFIPTAKDDRDAAVAEVDVWIRRKKLEISREGCPHLIAQMSLATWNNHRTDFARTADHGHFDLIAALVYLVRNVRQHSGRIPEGWNFNRDDQFKNPRINDTTSGLRLLLGG